MKSKPSQPQISRNKYCGKGIRADRKHSNAIRNQFHRTKQDSKAPKDIPDLGVIWSKLNSQMISGHQSSYFPASTASPKPGRHP